jgi:hypothetical protein
LQGGVSHRRRRGRGIEEALGEVNGEVGSSDGAGGAAATAGTRLSSTGSSARALQDAKEVAGDAPSHQERAEEVGEDGEMPMVSSSTSTRAQLEVGKNILSSICSISRRFEAPD